MSSAVCFNLDQSKIKSSANELKIDFQKFRHPKELSGYIIRLFGHFPHSTFFFRVYMYVQPKVGNKHLGPYSPTVVKNVLSLVLQIFSYKRYWNVTQLLAG